MTENVDGQNVINFYNVRKIQFQFFCVKKCYSVLKTLITEILFFSLEIRTFD